ncbi:MAG: hypothetical protein RL088_481 [Verrucomicrobiota bacterium]|jgi:alkaline phosphatase
MKHTILLATAGILSALSTQVEAAPTISRLTPPSAMFSFGDPNPPIIARFLPGQRFDLQCTASPSAGQTITSVVFKVDGVVVPGSVTLTTTGLVGTLPPNSAVASSRAYSLLTPGIHTLEATVTQSDSSTKIATGNFEIVRVPGAGSLKNVIIMIGDGMGAAHRTAARIMSKGVQMGKANEPLNMDTFPITGMIQTASLNSIITDSSPGAACYSTGNKSNNNQQGCFPDDTTDVFDNPRVELIGEFLARKRGKALGIVTTSDVFDATPGSFGTHTSNRGAGTGISDQYLDEAHNAYAGVGASGAGLKVLLGGGRKWFLPNTTTGSARSAANDYVLPADVVTGWGLPGAGAIDPARDLLADFGAAGFQYAPDGTSMVSAANNAATTRLLGLFAYSNMNVALDKINGPSRRNVASGTLGAPVVSAYGFPDQPMLDEMTDAAIKVLNRDPEGFVLMVEAASIDKQAHNMDTERWILDTIEFDRAIGVAKNFAATNKNTLVIITADHECAGAAIIGGSMVTQANLAGRAVSGLGTAVGGPRNGVVGTYEAAGFPTYLPGGDGYPVSTDIDNRMLIGYGANADRNEDWLTNELPLRDSQQPNTNAGWLPSTTTPYAGIVSSLPAGPLNRDLLGGFVVTGQIQDPVAAHTASDIPLSAFGRGSQYFSGYMDNTDVFFRIFNLTGVK